MNARAGRDAAAATAAPVAREAAAEGDVLGQFWSCSEATLLTALGSARSGLDTGSVAQRLSRYGYNHIADQDAASPLALLARQFANPLVLILVFGALVSAVLHEWIDAGIIVAIVVGSAILSFSQEYRASAAVTALRQRLALKTRVRRDGVMVDRPIADIVPGDIIQLAAGNLIPADGRILAAKDFLVTEASLTGESMPVEKRPGIRPSNASLSDRSNCVFMGSAVRSGTAEIVAVTTGRATAFGAIADRLRHAEPETEFARGIARFGGMLLRLMLLIVIAVLIANQFLGRPFAESLLFAVALAVGLSPELLPAIISVTLSAGARHLARGGVIVRRLDAIENLGSIDILCTDKTGTLTKGEVSLEAAIGPDGEPAAAVREAAYLNASFESGIANPLDAALVAAATSERWCPGDAIKRDEIPYDFMRRRLSIVVEEQGCCRMITKGAYDDTIAACSYLRHGDRDEPLNAPAREELDALFQRQGTAGLRALAIAERRLQEKEHWDRTDEHDLVFLGFLLFLDPPRPDAARTIYELAALGITIKVISGDNRYVTRHVAEAVGLTEPEMLTGAEIGTMTDAALIQRAPDTALFVEIDPQQKERIVRALQHAGHTVGFLGDGINDAPALHDADVGISVDQAVDVARESADIVLLKRDLDVLRQGVVDGRRTFANTMKYIAITTSANFGNMISMAVATPLLPFLPLLPKQILLNNFLSDLPSIAISTDYVDSERAACPRRWDIKDVQRFMIVFGLVSSCFDFATFAILYFVVRADEAVFQTVWFIVSLLTEVLIVLVLRTQRPVFASRPSPRLAWSIVTMAIAALLLPNLPPVAGLFGFKVIHPGLFAAALAIVIGYVFATELSKRFYYRAAK
jgi:Mg2+-importing ATPase